MMNKRSLHIIIPVVVIWMLLVWHRGIAGYIGSPLLILASAGYLVYYLTRKQTNDGISSSSAVNKKAAWTTCGVCALLVSAWAVFIFKTKATDIKFSDIIPMIKEVYYQRFISGEYVYNRVEGYDYISWIPNYLPLHWLPFVPAFYFGFDPRYVPLFLFMLMQFLYVHRITKLGFSTTETIIKIVLPFALLASVMHKFPDDVAHTVELLIVSYYLLLAFSMLWLKDMWKPVGLTATILSRYTVVFFIPIDLVYAFIRRNKKELFVYAGAFVLVCLVYVIPFMIKSPWIFFEGAEAYDTAALGEWDGKEWQKPGDKPFQIFRGYGFASWFYEFASGELMAKIHLLKKVLVAVMGLNILFWIFVRPRNKQPMAMVAILFFTITLFFSFVLVPYGYLFWNVLFLLPVLCMNTRFIKPKTT